MTRNEIAVATESDLLNPIHRTYVPWPAHAADNMQSYRQKQVHHPLSATRAQDCPAYRHKAPPLVCSHLFVYTRGCVQEDLHPVENTCQHAAVHSRMLHRQDRHRSVASFSERCISFCQVLSAGTLVEFGCTHCCGDNQFLQSNQRRTVTNFRCHIKLSYQTVQTCKQPVFLLIPNCHLL